MPSFAVKTPGAQYNCVVERGALAHLPNTIPAKAGKLFVVTTRDVWQLHGPTFSKVMNGKEFHVLFFPGGEDRKRMAEVEALAEQMVEQGADRSSLVIAFGGGIVGDLGGFLAAIFMRGIPVIQVPTTLLAQVDASVGGKTGTNLVGGKNLVGSFHQPLAVIIDPDVLRTLSPREFRAGMYEVLKCGIIRSERLFQRMVGESEKVLAMDGEIVEDMIAESVRIKAEVVSEDEKEGDLRRILNYGHTIGHALEAETKYERLLHGEAVAFGMRAVAHLARMLKISADGVCDSILKSLDAYGAIPSLKEISADSLMARLGSDKKTIQGKVHFVLADRIGSTVIRTGLDPAVVREATVLTLQELQ